MQYKLPAIHIPNDAAEWRVINSYLLCVWSFPLKSTYQCGGGDILIMTINAHLFNGSLRACLSPLTSFRKVLNNNRELLCFTVAPRTQKLPRTLKRPAARAMDVLIFFL